MIFKRSTFYVLAEFAIDAFFKGIVNNFLAPKLNFYVGMKIDKITENYAFSTVLYLDGKIENISSEGDIGIIFTIRRSTSKGYDDNYHEIPQYYEKFNIMELKYISDGVYEVVDY